MSTTFNVTRQPVLVDGNAADLFKIGFGTPADNSAIVRDAETAVTSAIDGKGGKLALVSGPASLPAAIVLGHKLVHMFGAVAIFDPKMDAFIVAVSHNPDFATGDTIANASVAVDAVVV
jgi:CRISPR-associated protein Csx3